jgi:hypothetical protein
MLADCWETDRRHAWPLPFGRARRHFGALGALSTGLALSVACGGNVTDSGAAKQDPISQYCARYAECVVLPQPQAVCEENLKRARTSATDTGCTALWGEFWSCVEQHPSTCEVDRTYVLTPECDLAADAVEECILDRQCSFGSGACPNPPCLNTCDIDCADFAAECSGPPGQAMMCVCTKGGRAGSQFSVADCGTMRDALPATCR